MKYGLLMGGLNPASFNPLFTETGTVRGLKNIQGGPGSDEVEFDFNIASTGAKFASSPESGSGTITRYPGDTVDAMYEGSVMIGGDRIEWEAFETGKVDKDGKTINGLEIVTFPHSPGMNSFIMETKIDLSNGRFENKAYEWI
jgi:hypothetical protein